ncbi:hypothetical protein PSTG_15825 [Puccinia striiformis f. sp. tritici PST-78]|uniref:Tet-like 2OG-Fe(II) oxygenase domain-containing protein n=1 Tax=Puccinia striiformis f. sp. tritici PST-78 TaxID=1165861 RepID=A0A0L0UVC5_9BASI|nr:hypothetical protein PSTG_15825 [Puccinia striiformis f. sp. tritici PST-78]
METIIKKSISIKNLMKGKNRKKHRENNRHSEYSLEINESGLEGQSPIWSRRSYRQCHLYPAIRAEKKNPPRRPTAEEIVNTLHSLDHGKVIVMDKTNRGKIIASKKFVNPVGGSRGWGGRMWAVGWRKCMKALEILGCYIKYYAVRASPKEYCQQVKKAGKVLNKLGRMFKNLANVPFESNRQIMKNNKIPSFSSSEFDSQLSKFDCAPHITFTTHSFYNPPHTDKGDVSDYAFALFVPTNSANGTLADPLTGYNVTGGRFAFPDYNFCIDFKEQGIVKMIWAANSYKHCTLPSIEPKQYTQMAMSLQINRTTLHSCRDIKNGTIYLRKTYLKKKNLYFGGHRNILNGIVNRK